jgi:cytochrome b pre-mRNA-processing protein 3
MMFKNLFRPAPARAAAQALYLTAVGQARRPGFYTDLGVPDTVDGRFDMIVVHVMLLIRRMRAGGEAGRRVSQELFDYMFQDMDRSLREAGVGDLSVGKHVKKMAKAFYGRAEAYETAIDTAAAGDVTALAAALTENIYRHGAPADAPAQLANYVLRADRYLQQQPVDDVVAGRSPFDVALRAN